MNTSEELHHTLPAVWKYKREGLATQDELDIQNLKFALLSLPA